MKGIYAGGLTDLNLIGDVLITIKIVETTGLKFPIRITQIYNILYIFNWHQTEEND